MTVFFLRVMLLTLAGLGSVNIGATGLARATQPPLPTLLYGSSQQLHLLETNCAAWLSPCVHRDHTLLAGLDTFSVAHWSPDGAYIAVKMLEGWMIYPADCLLDSDNCQPTLLDSDADDIRLAWGPDGSALSYLSDGILHIITRGCWDGSASCIERDILLSAEVTRQPDWSADGRYLAFITLSRDIYVLDMACLDAPDSCLGSAQFVTFDPEIDLWPSLSSDGSRVAFEASTDLTEMSEQIFIQDVRSGQRTQVTYHTLPSFSPDWSRDDRYIAYTGFGDLRPGMHIRDLSMNVYVYDVQRAIHVLLVRSPERDMYPNWGP